MGKQWVVVLCVWFCSYAVADVYKWVDESGRVHYSDTPHPSAQTQPIRGKITRMDAVDASKTQTSSSSKKTLYKKKVTMYSTSWCGYCKRARKYFIEQGIPFVEYDIEKNASAKKAYDAIGGSGVPVIVMGKRSMKGFSKGAFNRFYGI